MVWRQVEMDIGNPKYPEDVQSSFLKNCQDAQKTELFYQAVSLFIHFIIIYQLILFNLFIYFLLNKKL